MKPYRPYFQSVLKRHYPDTAPLLTAEVEKKFQQISPDIAFSKRSGNPMDRRMEISAYFLTAIIILDHRNERYDIIRGVMLDVAREYVKPENKWQIWKKKLPALFIGMPPARALFRCFDKMLRNRNHPDGFVLKILTDKKETLGLGYGVDILECGICKLFAKHRMQKYAPILCEIDYITTSLAGLTLERTGTIANGADKCDFRFRKNKQD